MKFALGAVVGALLLAVIGWQAMPTMMLQETVSPYDIDKTVETIRQNALDADWVVAGVTPLHKSVEKHGGKPILPVMLINLCQADHASSILSIDADRKLSVMMPCTISVYTKQDGKTYIGYMNAGLMGRMFGGNVATVMSLVADQQLSFIAFAK